MKPDFEARWNSILLDCGMEFIPQGKLGDLARRAGGPEMAFLLREATRIEGERRLSLPEHVSDDVSDEFWRIGTCLAEIFRRLKADGAAFLLDELRKADSPDRPAAACLLRAAFPHTYVEELKALLETETNSEVRDELSKAISAPPPASRPWWQFWNG
jgi:hypothetical protein